MLEIKEAYDVLIRICCKEDINLRHVIRLPHQPGVAGAYYPDEKEILDTMRPMSPYKYMSEHKLVSQYLLDLTGDADKKLPLIVICSHEDRPSYQQVYVLSHELGHHFAYKEKFDRSEASANMISKQLRQEYFPTELYAWFKTTYPWCESIYS